MTESIIGAVKVLIEIGLEVYRAFKSGDKTKTVGEIMAGRKADLDVLDEYDAEAKRHFGVG